MIFLEKLLKSTFSGKSTFMGIIEEIQKIKIKFTLIKFERYETNLYETLNIIFAHTPPPKTNAFVTKSKHY